jgi:hypothetical protein
MVATAIRNGLGDPAKLHSYSDRTGIHARLNFLDKLDAAHSGCSTDKGLGSGVMMLL